MSTEHLSLQAEPDGVVSSIVSESPAEPLSRRGFLRTAAVAGGGLIVAGVAGCAPSVAAPAWTYRPAASSGTDAAQPSGSAASAAPSPEPSHDHASTAPSGSPAPADHDAAALAVVKRFLDGEYGQSGEPDAFAAKLRQVLAEA